MMIIDLLMQLTKFEEKEYTQFFERATRTLSNLSQKHRARSLPHQHA